MLDTRGTLEYTESMNDCVPINTTCRHCRFWTQWDDPHHHDHCNPFGDCRKNAPHLVMESKFRGGVAVSMATTKWPSTRSLCRACGQFAPAQFEPKSAPPKRPVFPSNTLHTESINTKNP